MQPLKTHEQQAAERRADAIAAALERQESRATQFLWTADAMGIPADAARKLLRIIQP